MGKAKRAREIVKLTDWVTDWWLPIVRSQLKESTFDSYRRNLQLHVLPSLGEMPLHEITPRMLTSMYVDLLASGRLNGDRLGLSPRTVRYIHAIIHKALADAVDDGLLKSNPAERAKAPRPRRTAGHVMRVWEPHQLARFLEHVRDNDLAPLWHLAAFTGMRRGELLGLRWADVDFEHRCLSIRRSVVVVAYRVIETTPKNHHARVIDVDDASMTVLRAERERRQVMAAEMGRSVEGDDRVFCRSDGQVLHPGSVTVQFRAAVRAAGLPQIRFHDLRHTHATLALRAGVVPKVIAERLGHHTPEFTMHQYAHVLPGMQAEAAARVASLVATAASHVLPHDNAAKAAEQSHPEAAGTANVTTQPAQTTSRRQGGGAHTDQS